MRLRRMAGLLLTGGMVLTLFAGCGREGVGRKEESAGNLEKDSRPVVTVMTNTYCEDDLAAVEKACPEIRIQWASWCVNSGEVSDEYYERLYNKGVMPDIVLGNSLPSYEDKDRKYFRDLSGEDLLSGINAGLLNNYRKETGELFWIPGMIEYTALAFNDEMFEKYEIPKPTDHAGIMAAIKAFREKGVDAVSVDFGTEGKSYRAWSVICALNADLLQGAYGQNWAKKYGAYTDETILDKGDQAVWPQIFQRLVELKEKGVLTKEQLDTDSTTMLANLKEDKAPITLMDSASYNATQASAGKSFVLQPFFNPVEENGWLLVNAVPRYAVSNKVTDARMKDVLQVLSTLCSTEVYKMHDAGRGGVMDVSQNNGTPIRDGNDAIINTLKAGNTIVPTTDDGLNAAAMAVLKAICEEDATAEEAYDRFVQTVREVRGTGGNMGNAAGETLFTISGAGFSNLYDEKLGIRPAASAFCNTLLQCREFKDRGIQVMVANADLVNMPMLDGEYTEDTVGFLFSNQRLYVRTLTVGELVRILNRDMYLTHRVRQNLPVMAGAGYEVSYKEGGWSNEELGIMDPGALKSVSNSILGPKPYKVTAILRDGRPLAEDETLTVAGTRVEMFYLAENGTDTTFAGWEDFDKPFMFCHQYLQKYLREGGGIMKPTPCVTVQKAG